MNYSQVFFFPLAVQKTTSRSSVLSERWPFQVPLASWLCCWERWIVGHSPTLGEIQDIKILMEKPESSEFFSLPSFVTLGPPTHCLAQWQLSLHGCHWYSIFARKTWAQPPANRANFRAFLDGEDHCCWVMSCETSQSQSWYSRVVEPWRFRSLSALTPPNYSNVSNHYLEISPFFFGLLVNMFLPVMSHDEFTSLNPRDGSLSKHHSWKNRLRIVPTQDRHTFSSSTMCKLGCQPAPNWNLRSSYHLDFFTTKKKLKTKSMHLAQRWASLMLASEKSCSNTNQTFSDSTLCQ